MNTHVTHPSVRIKGTENNYSPSQCFEPLCETKIPHMHCPFCVKSDIYQDPVILKAHYRVKHVDKGIDFAGLKVLRCCDHCDIVGIIKGEKKFKGAHWHCYKCKNGFNRRDEALKHYKTHFRNPHTTFQIQVTQEVSRASNSTSPSEVNSAAQNISATSEVTIHPTLSPAVTSIDGQELLNQVEKARLSNGKPPDGIVHVSVAANETIETVAEEGQTITIIQDGHLDGSPEDNTFSAQIISSESLLNPQDTISRKYDELVEKYHNLEVEKYKVDQELERQKQKNQQLREAMKVLQKNQQKLIEQFSVPMNSSLQEILDEMTNQHKNLLHNHLSLLKQTYVAELVSQSSTEENMVKDDNEQTILNDIHENLNSKGKSDNDLMPCVISTADINEMSSNTCSNSQDSGSLTDSLGDQIVHVIVSGPPNGDDESQSLEGNKYVIHVKESGDDGSENCSENVHIQSSSGETYIISNASGHPSLNRLSSSAIFTEASAEGQFDKKDDSNSNGAEDITVDLTQRTEEIQEPPVKKLKS